jgi:DNA-binding MarR family transcriptional regulator
MVKQSAKPAVARAGEDRAAPRSGRATLPDLPAGVPDDESHRAANVLHSAALRLVRRARTADTTMDLDGARASLLSVLVFAGPQPVTKLAEIEQVSAPAITKTVAALVERGLAERTQSTSDRRVVWIGATESGRALLERGRAARVRVVAELVEGLPREDVETLRRAAAIIARQL